MADAFLHRLSRDSHVTMAPTIFFFRQHVIGGVRSVDSSPGWVAPISYEESWQRQIQTMS